MATLSETLRQSLQVRESHTLVVANSKAKSKGRAETIIGKPKQPPAMCECGATKSKGAIRCRSCFDKAREKINWPDSKQLQQMVEESSFLAASRLLGVSDNAIRKRLKNH